MITSIESYQKMNRIDFILNYEVALMSYFASTRNNNTDFSDEGNCVLSLELNIIETEKDFIKKLNKYLNKRYTVIRKYHDHILSIGKVSKYNLTTATDLMSHNDKREFLEYKLHKIDDSEKLERVDEYQRIKENDLLDYSSTTGTERIIYLEKLGVLDFLKSKEPFNMSNNALATALSGVIGINASTIQSYINPIDNPTAVQKNNPLTKDSKVKKIVSKLSDIGFSTSN